MKLATIRQNGSELIAIQTDNGDFISLAPVDGDLPATLIELIQVWDEVRETVSRRALTGPSIEAADVEIVAPIPVPIRDIICVGKNYFEHAREFTQSGFDSSGAGQVIPQSPVIFTKATTSVTGPNQQIPLWLDPTGTVDYEGELAVIIGRDAFKVDRTNWREVVFGYTIINDVTSRELQRKHQQWFIGKGIDGFCPMGPVIVTADEFGEPDSQIIETWVNGEIRQRAALRDLIFDIPTLIETISAVITLKAGDIIATGTPAGVGIGFDPPRYLVHGDQIKVSISKLGILQNHAVGTAAYA